MADSTLPPPPAPAPGQGAADAPLPALDAPPAKPTTRKPAAAKAPAAAKPAAAKAPAAVEPAPVVTPPAATVEHPNPYAPVATAPTAPSVNPYSTIPSGPSSTLSVLALVFGILGLVLSLMTFGLLPAIAGVILGHIALKREPHARGMGMAGLVTGYVGVGISVLWGLVIVIPALLFFGAISGLGSGF